MLGAGTRHVVACFAPVLLALPLGAQPALREYGRKITLGFPNEHHIMGLGGLSYDPASQVWSVVAEEMRGTEASAANPATADPRIYSLRLDFDSGSLAVADPPVVHLRPGAGLKLEDIAGPNPDGSFWVVSEANSRLESVSQLVSRNLLAAPDLSTFDPDTFENSRLVRVRAEDGAVLEDVALPDFVRWDARYSWDPYECVGNRPFQGFHGASALPAAAPGGQRTLVVGIQSALYQDGPSPTEFEGSRTRLLFYDLPGGNATHGGGAPARYSRSYRYDTSHLTMRVFEKGARHFNALSGVLALSDTSLLVAEIEDFTGFGGIETISRIFHVRLQPADTVDHCRSLASCNVSAPAKALLWERAGTLQLDGIARGPAVTVEGVQWPTVALVYESDDRVGAEFELLVLNEAALHDGSTPLWAASAGPEALRRERIAVVGGALAVAALIALAQWPAVRFFCPTRNVAARVVRPQEEGGARSGPWVPKPTAAHYLLWSCIANSMLVGGLTFGFQGMVLILWKQGVFTDTCACGKFCAGFKEQVAAISAFGFFVSIGSRIFLGFVLDSVGPKITSTASSFTCFTAFLVLAAAGDDGLGAAATAAWLLLAFGGAGLHISGFHATQLFNNEGRVAASAGISAGFGASSLVFPLMQVLHQYADLQLQAMAAFYAGLVLLVTLNNFVVQPWEKVQGGMDFRIDPRVHRRAWWRRDARWKPVLHSVRGVLRKFEFWGEALFYSVSMLLLTHYLGTSVHLMVEKGDVPLTSNPNDWTDYMFSRLAGLFNSLGFIWFPLVEGMMARYRWSTCYLALFAVQLAFAVVLLLPSLEVQVLGFLLQSLGRLMLFSFHHAYIQDRFGSEYFGTLNGISSLMAAVLSLLSYPFQLLSVFALRGNFSLLFVPIGALLLLSALFPLIHRRIPLFNWAETACVDPLKFRYPTTEREVVELVRGARTLRCAGAMHSCAPLIDTDGIILCLGRMDRILEIDVGRKTARVQAGVKIHDLCEALKAEGLAVGTLGTIDWQTFVGAVMTGTHGGSLTIPSLHAFVESYRMVRADGATMEVSRADEDDTLFRAMAPSMGVFGVVTEAVVRCVPLQHLEARLTAMDFEDFVPAFKDTFTKNKYARVVVYPALRKATVWTANPVAPGEAVKRGAAQTCGYVNFRDEYEKAWLEESLHLQDVGEFDRADRLVQRVLDSQLKRLGHYEGEYNFVLCKERNHGIPHADMEFNFDFAAGPEVLRAVGEYCAHHRLPYYNFEVRCTMQDDALLSCCHSRDAMWIDFQAKEACHKAFFGAMEDLLAPFSYRKHWAKGMDHTNPLYIRRQFPGIAQFVKLAEAFDPEGKFRNQHVDLWLKEQQTISDGAPAPAGAREEEEGEEEGAAGSLAV